jgi:Rrf2 family iron-sulfur cluster assembly transcriptional regulator
VLSTTAEYALRALLSLANEPDKATLGRDLAASSGVPANYLSKILLDLKKGGFVQAVRGTGGGYRLGRPPEEVRLMDVVEFVDGTAARPGCFLAGSDACSDDDLCLAHDRWAAVRDQYVSFLESTTLADVSEHSSRLPPARTADPGSAPHE